MELVACEACENEISMKATACPKCGHPQEMGKPQPKLEQKEERFSSILFRVVRQLVLGVVLSIVILVLIIWGIAEFAKFMDGLEKNEAQETAIKTTPRKTLAENAFICVSEAALDEAVQSVMNKDTAQFKRLFDVQQCALAGGSRFSLVKTHWTKVQVRITKGAASSVFWTSRDSVFY